MDYTVLGQRDCSCQAFAQDQARSVHPRVRSTHGDGSTHTTKSVFTLPPSVHIQCKHVLAVRLAGSLGRLEEQEVADETFEVGE